MKLFELLAPLNCTVSYDIEITGIHNDSRLVKPGYLFIAYPGALADGRRFIQQAIASGATAVLYEAYPHETQALSHAVPCIAVNHLSAKLGLIAKTFYGNPAQAVNITGITGTNGKTTIAYQLAQAYEYLRQPAAYIGTLGQGRPSSLQTLANTTPDVLCLQFLLNRFAKASIKQVCMEVSSHAIALNRIEGVEFSHAIYTNLSHEHLDFHHTMQAYAATKAQLFALPSLQSVLINADDQYAALMMAKTPKYCKTFTYGLNDNADIYAHNWQTTMTGSVVDIRAPWGGCEIKTNMIGDFNLYNSLAIFAQLMISGISLADAASVMALLQAVPGRMEVVVQSPCVIVDYAHTPDALQNVLQTLSRLKQNRLLVVFGCGGDRDKGKRPMMGQIAGHYADRVIITSDNPRNENPHSIMSDIAAGVDTAVQPELIADRHQAIQQALNIAEKNDIVLIAGKGHEAYQQIGQERIDFSDQQLVRNLLKVDYKY